MTDETPNHALTNPPKGWFARSEIGKVLESNRQALDQITQGLSDDGTSLSIATIDTGGAHVSGRDPATVTGNTTASDGDVVLADATSAALTVTLPAPSDGASVIVKKTDSSANAVTVAQNGSETIDGATSVSLSSQYASIELVSDGANWFEV